MKIVTNGLNNKYKVTDNGELYVQGQNRKGQLGLGDYTNRYTFTKVSIDNVKDVVCRNDYTFVLKNDGSVYGCGHNYKGQLGLGKHITDTNKFTKLDIDNIKKISCYYNTVVFLKNDGSVYICGESVDGHSSCIYSPKRINFIPEIRDVEVCDRNIFMITKSDKLYVYGENNMYGQLGKPLLYSVPTPSKVSISNVKKVYAYKKVTFLLKNDNSVWCCGCNSYNELGVEPHKDYVRKFTKLGVYNGIKDILFDFGYTIILTNDNTSSDSDTKVIFINKFVSTKYIKLSEAGDRLKDLIK